MSNKLSEISGPQIAMARRGLGMSQRDISRITGVNKNKIVFMERGQGRDEIKEVVVDFLSRYVTFLRLPGTFGVMIRDGASEEWRNEKDPARITAAGSESNATMMDTHSTATEADD